MDKVLEGWRQLSASEQSLIATTGFALIVVLILLMLRKNVQQGLIDSGVDQITAIPGMDGEADRKPVRLSPLLSWLIVITLGVTLFDLFSQVSLLGRLDIHKLLINGWILIFCYIGVMLLMRKCIAALAKFLTQPEVKKKLRVVLALDDQQTGSRYDDQDAVNTLVDSISAGFYCMSAAILAILFVAAVLNLDIISVFVVGFLSGLGRLSIALIMAGVGFAGLRYFQGKNNELPEKTAFYLSALTLIGCILLALTLLGNNTGNILWPLLIVLLLLAAVGFMVSDTRSVSMPDILAGLYLRAGGYRGSLLRAEFEGYRLNKIGWETSVVRNDQGETQAVKNHDLLAAISMNASRTSDD
ncbi:MAG: hypothetical protein ACU84J_01470 [Gammaproteobacteria bacterium]